MIALVVAGLLWWHSNSSKASQAVALAECKVAAKQYTNAQKKLTTAISNGQTSAQTSTSDVADANTLTTLNQALQDAGNPADTAKCDSSLNATELKSHTKELQNDASDMADKTDAINNAIKAVNTSKATADTNTLKSNLSSAISQAQGTLDNSAGSVADENTRTALQNAITEANTVMNGTSPSESTSIMRFLNCRRPSPTSPPRCRPSSRQMPPSKLRKRLSRRPTKRHSRSLKTSPTIATTITAATTPPLLTAPTAATTEVCSVLLFPMGR